MTTYNKLMSQSGITDKQIYELMDRFDVTAEELAKVCELKQSTMDAYLGTMRMPKKHQMKIASYFMRLLKEEGEGGTAKGKEQKTKPKENPKSYAIKTRKKSSIPSGSTDDDISVPSADGFEHLDVERIIFRPKNGVGPALQEAADISAEQGAEVLVRLGDRIITISTKQN